MSDTDYCFGRVDSIGQFVDQQFAELFADAPELDLPIDAYADVVGEANANKMEEMYMRKKKGVILTEYLDKHFGAPFLSKGIAIGEMRGESRGIAIGESRGIAIGEIRGEARGKAEGKAETILNFLRARFGKVPKETEKTIRKMTDSIALDSWAVQAATCASMKEFAEAVK